MTKYVSIRLHYRGLPRYDRGLMPFSERVFWAPTSARIGLLETAHNDTTVFINTVMALQHKLKNAKFFLLFSPVLSSSLHLS
jgi:hypothetical protein